MAEYDNPAARLLDLFERAHSLPDNAKLRDGWSDLLDVDPDDRAQLLHRLSLVIALPAQLRAAVTALPDFEEDVHLKRMAAVENTLSQLNLDGMQWVQIKSGSTDTVRDWLSFVSYDLRRQGYAAPATEEDVEHLRDQVKRFEHAVEEADIPENLRDVLIEQVTRLRESLDEYRLAGPEGVAEAVDRSRGRLLRDRSLWDYMSHPVVTQFIALTNVIITTFGTAGAIALGPGEPVEETPSVTSSAQVVVIDIDVGDVHFPELPPLPEEEQNDDDSEGEVES